jgi:glycosyltransferase involved in cell wall biosynthesis
VAKHGYVVSHSGAFSDRTAAFLASGRPVVVQDTGFSEVLPVGEGLLPFTTPDEAVAALESVLRDPSRHQRAARAVAEAHFDSDVVLRRLVDEAMS